MKGKKIKIMGKYGNLPVEEIDSAANAGEAMALLKEYRFAFGKGWKIWLG